MQRPAGHGAVPDGWQRVRLGDVAFLRKEQMRPLAEDLTPYVGLEHIGSGGSLNGRGWAGELISNKTVFHSGDTLYGKLRPNLRKVIRVAFDGVCSTDILAVACGNQTDHLYLTHVLRGEPLHEHAIRGTAGTKMPRTSWNHLAEFHFPLPPLSEQRAIAAVLDSIDDAIEGAEAVIAATAQLRDSLLHDLLTRGLPGQHTEFRDVPGLGATPADWEVVRLGDVAEVQTGRAVKKGSPVDGALEIPYLSVANVKDGYLDLSVVKAMLVSEAEIERFSLKHGDVLFTEGGDADKLGRGTVWRTEIPICLHQNHIFAVRPHPDVLVSDFLSFFAGSGLGKRYFLGAAKQTTNLASVNSSQLKDMILPLPDIGEQKCILTALGRVDATLEVAREELAGLRLLKESTADALLTGRVRVGEYQQPVGGKYEGT